MALVKSDAEWKASFDELAALVISAGVDTTTVVGIQRRWHGLATVGKPTREWKARFDELAALATSLGVDATAVTTIRDRAPLRLMDLHEDLLSLVPRKLSACGLARLACTSRQLHATCLAEAMRAIKEILAAGQRDAPLPASLAHLENVFHRLARLCGVRFAPASFCNALLSTARYYYPEFSLDLDAVEKLHVVLSRCRTKARRVDSPFIFNYVERSLSHVADLPIREDKEPFDELIKATCCYLEHARETTLRRVRVDQAIWCIWSARGPRCMKRTRELLEQHEGADDEGPDYEVSEDEDGGEVELEELIDGGADAVGVVVGGAWFPSLACALHPKDDHLGLEEVYEDKVYEDNLFIGDTFSMRAVSQLDSGGCTNPLCCHTRFNCRLVAGAMDTNFWTDLAEDVYRPPSTDEERSVVYYEPRHIDRLARLPNTGRLQPLTCPRAKRQREGRAGYRKWLQTLHDPAKLREAMYDEFQADDDAGYEPPGVVEGVPFGNRSFANGIS